ncbi:tRNA (adenosine(37)-N6)-threonylcarbamoyltransferase complex dimerization subunit type 1 TsaB [Persicitalea sp.]|uniref:tRNA (adenosine(37)-N6)-threonylcarbamoyltransferase complex dimerization subunit type 1 TsaB n=1 Tax=Persicitalea sp. TaxID=3100273 RepID=UPI0035939E80
MLILSIDTSTRGCSVAVHASGQLLAAYDLLTERMSSSLLTILMKNAVEQTGHTLSDLDAVAVAKGPGSYTGLRVSVSTAKGLCYALDKQLIGVETLAALTAQLTAFYPKDYLFCPMIDARRMEVFAAVFSTNLEKVQPTQAVILDADSFAEVLDKYPVVFFGDGAAKSRALLAAHPNAHFPDQLVEPSARTVGTLATEAYQLGRFEDLASFEPYYLKDFVGTNKVK